MFKRGVKKSQVSLFPSIYLGRLQFQDLARVTCELFDDVADLEFAFEASIGDREGSF